MLADQYGCSCSLQTNNINVRIRTGPRKNTGMCPGPINCFVKAKKKKEKAALNT